MIQIDEISHLMKSSMLLIQLVTICLVFPIATLTTVQPVEYDDEDPSFVTNWKPEWGSSSSGRPVAPKCVPIPSNLSLCRGIGYQQMRLPNLLEHDTMKEVIQQASAWVHLKNIQCHSDTQLFLCSLYSPVCLDRTIWPCRSLCEAVKAGCEGRMVAYGFPWPDMLKCDKFPPDNDLCITVQTPNTATTGELYCGRIH